MLKYLGGDVAGSYGRSIYSLVFFGGGGIRDSVSTSCLTMRVQRLQRYSLAFGLM